MAFGENIFGAIESIGERLVNHRTAELSEAAEAVFSIPSTEPMPAPRISNPEIYPAPHQAPEVVHTAPVYTPETPVAVNAFAPEPTQTSTIDVDSTIAQIQYIHAMHEGGAPDFNDPHLFEDKVA